MAVKKDPRAERVVAVCAGCGSEIHSGEGWRRLTNPQYNPSDPSSDVPRWLEYHHEEASEPTGEFTLDGEHELRAVSVVKTCTPKAVGRKAVAS